MRPEPTLLRDGFPPDEEEPPNFSTRDAQLCGFSLLRSGAGLDRGPSMSTPGAALSVSASVSALSLAASVLVWASVLALVSVLVLASA